MSIFKSYFKKYSNNIALIDDLDNKLYYLDFIKESKKSKV